MDNAKCLCQFPCFKVLLPAKGTAMKIHAELDCTPEEARRFLGLPDVTKANEIYVEALAKAMQGVGSIDQMQAMIKQVAPMGEIGMNLFKQFMASGGSMGGKKAE
jgi:hypothetical protein